MKRDHSAASLRLALLLSIALPLLCPGRSSAAPRASQSTNPCSAHTRAEVNRRKAHFERDLRKALGRSSLQHVHFDPCSGKHAMTAHVAGCEITAKNGGVVTKCAGGSRHAAANRAGKSAEGVSKQSASDGSSPDWSALDREGKTKVRGQATMFGGPADKSTHGWSNLTANGSSTRKPGVAVNVDGNALSSGNRSRLGGYWLMHMNDGDWVYQQTDLGPSGWTGHKIDLSAGSLPAHGMSTSTLASWNNVSGTYLGKNPSYAKYNGKCVANCGRARR